MTAAAVVSCSSDFCLIHFELFEKCWTDKTDMTWFSFYEIIQCAVTFIMWAFDRFSVATFK